MNTICLMGRLTKDPELRYTSGNNTAVATFTLAVNRSYKQEGQPEADFISIVAWTKTAEFVAKYFTKGMQVAVTGRIQTRTWDDDQNVKHYVTEVVADHAYFADSKKDGNTSQPQSAPPSEQSNPQQGGYQPPSSPPPPTSTDNTQKPNAAPKPWER